MTVPAGDPPALSAWARSSIVLGAWRGDSGRARPELLLDFGNLHPHAMIVSPTGGGKTWNSFYPTLLLSWFRSCVVFDIKGELWDRTAAQRARWSHVLRYAPTEHGSPVGYNLLNSIRPGHYAVAHALNVAEHLAGGEVQLRQGSIWDTNGKNALSAIFLWVVAHLPEEEKCLAGASSVLAKGRWLGEALIQNQHPDPVVRKFVKEAAEKLWRDPNERYISGVVSTMNSYLIPYSEPILAAATRRSSFDASSLMCGPWPVTLYVTVPESDLRRCLPLLRVMLSQIMGEQMRHEDQDRDGRPKRHPVLFCMDEFADMGLIGDTVRHLAKQRSYWMRSLIGLQSTDQAIALYGQHSSLFNNVRLIFTRQNWLGDARAASELLGEAKEQRESVSRSSEPLIGTPKGVSHSSSTSYRRVLQVAEVTRLPADRLLINGQERPIMAWRTPPEFWQHRVGPPPAESAVLEVERPWEGALYPTPMPDELLAQARAVTAASKEAEGEERYRRGRERAKERAKEREAEAKKADPGPPQAGPGLEAAKPARKRL